MLRAKKLAKEAKKFATIKKAAESTVVRWQWATAHLTEPEPGYFETRRQERGRPIKTAPTGWKEERAHEGYDAQDRIVALHVQRNTPNWQYETFYRYEPDGIARFNYDYGDHAWLGCVFMTTKGGVVTQADHIYPGGHRTAVYRFDAFGHYAGYDQQGAFEKKATKLSFDFDSAPDGTILRAWWVWPDRREVYWVHPLVKGAMTPKAAAKKAAKKPTTAPAQKRKKKR